MRLGLLADIHEHTAYLKKALARFGQLGVDQIVVLGDVFEMGSQIEETCKLLMNSHAIGVWGNHDFGLCWQPDDDLRQRFPGRVIEFMTTLRARLIVEDCHFTHVEPWLDPLCLTDLWYFEGAPDEHRNLDRIFQATSQRLAFAGHIHRWCLARPSGIVSWNAKSSIYLNNDRYFVVVGAVCLGTCGIFDTTTSELIPIDLDTMEVTLPASTA